MFRVSKWLNLRMRSKAKRSREMYQLPDTDNRIQQALVQGPVWNECGYRCHCGNPLLMGTSKRLVCYSCDRFWYREDLKNDEL